MLVQLLDQRPDLRDIVVVVLRRRVARHAALRGWIDDATECQLEAGGKATAHGLVRVLPGAVALACAVAELALAKLWPVVACR